MADSRRKRISVHDVQIGMVLDEDAITPKGQMLIPAGTSITEKHLFRMNLYQILSVVIRLEGDPKDPVAQQEVGDLEELPLQPQESIGSERILNRTESFLRFNKVFGKVEQNVRTQFDEIIGGGTPDRKKLLATTQTLMNSVRLKSDLFAYMSHMKADDQHTFVHSVNVGMLCNIFGQWLKLSPEETEDLTMAGLVHDIGKTQVPSEVLNKPDRLTEDEFNQVRMHTKMGYDLVKDLNISDAVKQAVLLHHERNDGSGYPFGFQRDQIPEFAKIVAIADVYEAMTSARTYHKKFSPFKVIQLFEQESYGYLDTKYLFTFLENIAHYYLGEQVRLTDGTEGKIVFIHNQSPSRPIIQSGDAMIDLLTDRSVEIDEIL